MQKQEHTRLFFLLSTMEMYYLPFKFYKITKIDYLDDFCILPKTNVHNRD